MNWIVLVLLVLGGVAASVRLRGFLRAVLWTAIATVASTLFTGGRVLVLPFILILVLEGIYWLALPRASGGQHD